jgi:HTH-type transcriptional regulator/antitoxin HipB
MESERQLRQRWGTTIRARRLELGLTQVELAERAGIPQANVSRIERGGYAPTDLVRIRLARALELEVRDVFTYEAVA